MDCSVCPFTTRRGGLYHVSVTEHPRLPSTTVSKSGGPVGTRICINPSTGSTAVNLRRHNPQKSSPVGVISGRRSRLRRDWIMSRETVGISKGGWGIREPDILTSKTRPTGADTTTWTGSWPREGTSLLPCVSSEQSPLRRLSPSRVESGEESPSNEQRGVVWRSPKHRWPSP